MTRNHLTPVSIAYAAATLLTAFISFGVSKETVAFVLLSTFLGSLLWIAAQSHFAWQDTRKKQREARQNHLRIKTSIQPKPFRDRLRTFFANRIPSHCEAEDVMKRARSEMSFHTAIHLPRETRKPPKSAGFIRQVLRRIRQMVRGTESINANDTGFS